MNAALLQILVALISQVVQNLLPKVANADVTNTVTAIITALEKILPDIIAAGGDLVTAVQNIIAALKGTDGVSPEQWAALDAFEARIDAEFDQAAKDEGV